MQASPKRPRVRSDIQADLAKMIASGKVLPGQNLPSEAELSLQLGVSRTVVREAIKGLEAKYLVRSRPRVGTVVLPREDWALLDAEVLEWIADYLDVAQFGDAVLEARRAIEPAAAELACLRASLADLAEIEKALNAMAEAGGDAEAFTRADLAFHEALLRASHNPVFLQFIHSIRAGLNLMLLASNKSVDDYSRTVESHRALLDALVVRNGALARAASLTLLQHATDDLKRLRD
ncbi:FadR/GntR family transcriptional regulator [Pseudogemmobacter bohemicus]|uniref:FadR/GntR family transcriptional regulator n=1 Tax=Pseudogemmobacter bohemicus TaxID=2250708 RepID=UPI0018E5538F|nr:FadR/GntR family transcriptional regulator [Pseudogemmobacter bohemicus]